MNKYYALKSPKTGRIIKENTKWHSLQPEPELSLLGLSLRLPEAGRQGNAGYSRRGSCPAAGAPTVTQYLHSVPLADDPGNVGTAQWERTSCVSCVSCQSGHRQGGAAHVSPAAAASATMCAKSLSGLRSSSSGEANSLTRPADSTRMRLLSRMVVRRCAMVSTVLVAAGHGEVNGA